MIKYILGILVLFVFAGCIQQFDKLGCCSPEAASRGTCDFQGEFSEPLASIIQNPAGNILQEGCSEDTFTCTVTFIIESSGQDIRKSYDIPICNSEENACVSGECLAQVCSPFAYAPTVSPSFRDLDSFRRNTQVTKAPFSTSLKSENLLNTSCMVLPMNEQLTTFFKNSRGSFINIFRFGVGSTFEDYEYYRLMFPISDFFCNINADVVGARDRFTNYLLGDIDYREKEMFLERNEEIVPLPERMINADNYCPLHTASPFLGPLLGGPGFPTYKMNQIVTTSREVDARQNQDGSTTYQPVGDEMESQYPYLDREFYASALRLEYRNELEQGLRQNPPLPAAFECETALQCQSGYCSFDTYYRGLCQTENDEWVECGCSQAQLNCVGKTAPKAPPDNFDINEFAESFNRNPDENSYVPQQLDTWFVKGSLNPSCDVYTVNGWETKDRNIIDDICILHPNNEYECGGYANPEKFLLSCTLANAQRRTYTCRPTSEEDQGSVYRDCQYDPGDKAITCNVQTTLASAPCVEQNGGFACGPNPENPLFVCSGNTCIRGQTEFENCQVNEQGMRCDVDGPVDYPGCIVNDAVEDGLLCGAKTSAPIQTLKSSPIDDAIFPRDIKFFGAQVGDPYSWMVVDDPENPDGPGQIVLSESYIGFSLLPSSKPLTRTRIRPSTGATYDRWEEELRQIKQLALFENTMLVTQCNLEYGQDYDVVRGPNQAGFQGTGGADRGQAGVNGAIYQAETDARACGGDPLDGWGTNMKEALYQSCFFRAPLVIREANGVNYGSDNVGTPECNTFEDDYAEFYFTPEFVLLKAHQKEEGEDQPWYLGDCKLDSHFVPITKTFGWCEGCSLLTSAYQAIESTDDPYMVESTERVFSDDFSVPQRTASTEVFVEDSGYNYHEIPESTLLRAEFTDREPVDPTFSYYGQKEILYFDSVPNSAYLQDKQAQYLRSGVLPILDVTADSNWEGNQELFDAVMPEGPSIVIVDDVDLGSSEDDKQVDRIKARIDELTSGDVPISTKAQFAIRLTDTPYGSQTAESRMLRQIAMLDNLREADSSCAPGSEESCIFSQEYVTVFVYPMSADEIANEGVCDGNMVGQEAVNFMSQISGYGLRNHGLLSYVEDLALDASRNCWRIRDQNGVRADPARSFFATVFARQVTLTKSGLMGIHIKDVLPFLDIPQAEEILADPLNADLAVRNTEFFCSVSSATASLAADVPVSVLHKTYARPSEEVICQDCSPYDPSCGKRGDPALVCADGSICTPPNGEFDPNVNYKCPDYTVADTCQLCTGFQNALSCERQYADGSSQDIRYQGGNSVGSIVSAQGDVIPDIIASIPHGERCCLVDAQGAKYTYFKQETSGSVRAPIVFNAQGDPSLDCGIPDFGASSDEFVCSNQNSPIKNYNLRCVLG